MPRLSTKNQWHLLGLVSLVFLIVLLLAGCGGSGSAGTSASGSAVMAPSSPKMAANASDNASMSTSSNQPQSAAASSANQGKQNGSSSLVGQHYLVKSLKVGMLVKDTRATADDLQSWISATDPEATSAGTDYEQAGGDNLYSVSLTFSVRSVLYQQIYHYLRDYPSNKGGHLTSFNESVQDVTNDYVDTDARLTNLRTERDRILSLMKQAQSMSDVLTIEQRLTDVEGQIESIQAHLNQLKDQVTFYNVSITLQPIDTAQPAPPTPGWSVGQVFHDAFAASIAFGQGLASFLIWILAFSFYIVPVLLIAWFVRKVRNRSRQSMPWPKTDVATPRATTPNPNSSTTEKEDASSGEPVRTPPASI